MEANENERMSDKEVLGQISYVTLQYFFQRAIDGDNLVFQYLDLCSNGYYLWGLIENPPSTNNVP